MKQFVSCNIETLACSGETAWVISIPTESVPDTALLLSGLLYGKVKLVKFADKSRTAVLSASTNSYSLNLCDTQIIVTRIWLEALLVMLLDVCLNGWKDTAHLDQDFEDVSVTVAVLPPER